MPPQFFSERFITLLPSKCGSPIFRRKCDALFTCYTRFYKSSETNYKKEIIYSSTTKRSPSKYIPCACHAFSSGAVTVCSIPGTQLVGCRLRPALRPSGCLLLTQNDVLSMPILLFEIKRSCKMRDQVIKEAAASPDCIWMSKTALNHVSRCCSVRFLDTNLAQIFLIPNSSFSIKRTVSLFMFTPSAIILT